MRITGADAQELSGDNSVIVHTFLRDDGVKIEGEAKTGEKSPVLESA